jgi:putative transcriptional regulator
LLLALSEALETPVSTLLGETVSEPETDDLKSISQKLEVINLQLSKRQQSRREIRSYLLYGRRES